MKATATTTASTLNVNINNTSVLLMKNTTGADRLKKFSVYCKGDQNKVCDTLHERISKGRQLGYITHVWTDKYGCWWLLNKGNTFITYVACTEKVAKYLLL